MLHWYNICDFFIIIIKKLLFLTLIYIILLLTNIIINGDYMNNKKMYVEFLTQLNYDCDKQSYKFVKHNDDMLYQFDKMQTILNDLQNVMIDINCLIVENLISS